MDTSAKNPLEFAVLQAVAECYLDSVDLDTRGGNLLLEDRLRFGNNHYDHDPAGGAGRTRVTDQQIKWFFENFDIVNHYQNDISGFSATVFFDRRNGEYTISFRSTEYAEESKGGDHLRDGFDGADGEINGVGIALAQTASMERYLENLRQGQRLDPGTGRWVVDDKLLGVSQALTAGAGVNITGYSLGGHLANVFTILHPDMVRKTYLFNAAGLGTINGLDPRSASYAAVLREKLALYSAVMLSGSEAPNRIVLSGEIVPGVVLTSAQRQGLSSAITDNLIRPPDPNRVYSNAIYSWVVRYLGSSMIGAGAGPLAALLAGLTTQGLGLSQLEDKLRNYQSSRDEFGDRVPDAFDTKLYEFTNEKVTSVFGKSVFFDPELVANTGYHPLSQAIYIEDQPMARGLGGLKFLPGDYGETHSITLLIDSLTVLDLLQGLDPYLTPETYRAIESSMANSVRTVSDRSPKARAFKAALVLAQAFQVPYGAEAGLIEAYTNTFQLKDADALELTIEAVGDLLGVDLSRFDLTPRFEGGGFADPAKRNSMHDAIAALRGSDAYNSLKGNALFVSLSGMTGEEILAGAMADGPEGLAYRYALDRLNPFVVLTDASIYGRHNGSRELDRWTEDAQSGRMTDEYLRDRAAFLHWKAKLDAYNKVAVEHDEAFDLAYEDLGTGMAVDLIGKSQGPTAEHRFVRFAAKQGSVVLGGSATDSLYGGEGGDRLEAAGGADYLEGREGPDKLSGGSGADLLLGGSGEDELAGGPGADTLIGGEGEDVYVINSGDGVDTIRDTGRNYIKWNGRIVAGLFESTGSSGPYRFITSDPALSNLTLTFNSPGTLSDGSGAALILESFEDPAALEESFGISLFEGKPTPVTTRSWVGDDYGSELFGEPEGEWIDAKGGADLIYGFGGDDYVDAGDGDDWVYGDGEGSAGFDLLAGGGGSDILIGDDGSDQLFGGPRIALADAIQGNSETPTSAKGDWLAGGEGEDLLIGGDAGDVLTGGGGEDVLAGGAGADFLMGDTDYRPPVRNWEFGLRADGWSTWHATANPLVNDPLSSAADVIYGGAGNDWVWAGLGDDIIDGGPGDDLLFGNRGSDWIEGGEGNDILAAGSAKQPDLSDPGDDYLSGGAGNDTLYGSAGGTFLFGDEGDDVIVGGPGSNFIDGGAGNDRISMQGADVAYGGDGDDRIIGFGVHGLSLYGDAGADLLRSGQGEDALFGGADDDVLSGAGGGDVLDGGTGNDRYSVSFGGGVDNLFDESGEDVIEIQSFETAVLGSSISPESIHFIDAADGGVSLTYGILGDEIRLGSDPLGVIERIERKHWVGSTFTVDVIDLAALWAAYLGPLAPTNSAPDLVHSLPDAKATEDESFNYEIPADAFSDPDLGDVLSYTVSMAGGDALPGWMSFDPLLRTLSGTPTNADVGALELTVTATDRSGASASGGLLLSVANTNDAPQGVGSVEPQMIEEESRFELAVASGLFADEDETDTLVWSARLAGGGSLPSWLAFDPETKHLSGTPTRHEVGTWSITVSVRDGSDATASIAFDLTVTKVPGQTLSGSAGSEVLQGGPGDDTLFGSAGSDALIGGEGDDTFVLAADGAWSAGYAAYNAGSPGNPGTGRIVAIQGKSRLFDTLDGGEGLDTVQGTSGHDAVFLDDGLSPFPGAAGSRVVGVERFLMGAGNDAVDLTSFDFALGAVQIEGEDGDDLLWTSAGDDTLLGGAGRDELYGGAGADYLAGGAGDDSLDGTYGADVLQGGEGNDALLDSWGGGILDGGTGNDALTGGSAAELFSGGKGNDLLRPGSGNDVVLFNRGDGADRVVTGVGAKTLSFGGGIAYEDLALERKASHLLVHLGNGESIELTDWYATAANAGFRYMQVIAEAMAGFDQAGTNALRDHKVERFDFRALVGVFDAARAADPMIARWQAMDALLDAHLAGSNDEALGGELAYRYGLTGTLAGQSVTAAKTALASPDFGSTPQSIASGVNAPGDRLLE